jgi:hypothetical protein
MIIEDLIIFIYDISFNTFSLQEKKFFNLKKSSYIRL